MTAGLLRPYPLPMERVRPGMGLLVVTAHLGLLWVANLYWPLQSVLQGAIQSVTVQIFQSDLKRSASAVADVNAPFKPNPQAISESRQRTGRAAMTLELPASQTEQSTPLAGTAQTAQTAPAKPASVAPRSLEKSQPQPQPELQTQPKAAVVPAPQLVLVERTLEEKLPELPPQLPALAAPPAPPTPSLPIAAPPAVVAAPPPLSALGAIPGATASPSPGTSATGNAKPGPGPAATGTSAPLGQGLNLQLPPRYIYRPPLAVPRRSLSELANDQLRRKPRDPFADAVNDAGHIDCLKDTPEGPAQGLLAIGPLLKRAIEEKCKK